MSRLIGDMTGNIFEEADSAFGLVSQPRGHKRALLPPEAQARGPCGFVGLQNQGMTCYLNSLLQTMFLTPELRAGLYQVPLQDLGMAAEETQAEAPAATTPAGTDSQGAAHESQEGAERDPSEAEAFAVDSLIGMGFPADAVKRALRKFQNDVQRAADLLLTRAGSGDKVELPNEDDTDMYQDLPALEVAGGRGEGHPIEAEGLPISMDLDSLTVEGLSQGNQHIVEGFKKRMQAMDGDGMELAAEPRAIESVPGTGGNGAHGSPRQGGLHVTEQDKLEAGEEAAAVIGSGSGADVPAIAVPPKPKRRRRGLIIELQKAFAWLQAVDQKAISTEDLTRAFGWEGSEARVQHDVHELNRILFDGIEYYLKGTQQESLVKNLYRGTLVNQVECLRCGAVSERQEEFSDIPVVVKGFSSLEESLAAAAKAEMLDGDNQYFCERCQAKVDARRSQRFRSLPPLLTLPLCRFEYDWDRDERRKITTPFSFPLTLNLAPYMAATAPGQPSPPDQAANGSAGPEGGPAPTALFDLLSVVIHSGSAHSGHYHAYIRDMLGEGKGRMEEPSAGQDVTRGFEAAAGLEGQVRGGMLFEGAGFNEGLEHAGSAMNALVEAAVQESGREATTAAAHENEQAQPREAGIGGAAGQSGEGADEPEYGHWYDFNDSNVSVVHWSAITSQFGGGNECAYMLTYRARLPPGQLLAPPALAAVTEDFNSVSAESEHMVNGVPASGAMEGAGGGKAEAGSLQEAARRALGVPSHLAPLVQRKNEQLREERKIAEETAAKEAAEAEAARAANQVRLVAHVPSDGYVRNGFLYSRHEDLSDVGRLLVLERSSTVGQLSTVVRQWFNAPGPELALYIVSPKIHTQEVDEGTEEHEQESEGLKFGGLRDWSAAAGGLGKEAESVTEDILLDEEGGGVDKQSNEIEGQGALDPDVVMSDATPEASVVDNAGNEQLAAPSAEEREGQPVRGVEGQLGADPRQRKLTDVFEGFAQNGDERMLVPNERPSGKGAAEKVGTSSSGSSADSRSRGVKRAAEGGEPQSRGRYQPEIIRGPQLLEFREPTEAQTSSESERRSAEGAGAVEGSGLSLSGSGGSGALAQGLNGVKLTRDGDGEGASTQETTGLMGEQPRTKKVRRAIYEIKGRINMRDLTAKLGDQIENGGGVLAWSTRQALPHGVNILHDQDMFPMDEDTSLQGAGVGQGWASSVDNGWDVQPTGWGSPSPDQPLFTVKIWNKLEPNAPGFLESFPVEAHTNVWMLKSAALKRHRDLTHESIGEDDVVLCRGTAHGDPGDPRYSAIDDEQALAVEAGIKDQEELWLQRQSAVSSSVLAFTMTVYGKAGMVASQLPLEVPRDALLVELVCLATERAAAALRDNAAATGADAPQDPQLVVFRDTAFGGKKELKAEDDGLIKLEDLGFEYGDQLVVEDRDAVSPEAVAVRVQRYVLPHERTADEAQAKFLASTMAATSNLHGPAEGPSGLGGTALDNQAIAAQANSLAEALTAALTAQKRAQAATAGAGSLQRGAGVPPLRLGKGLGRGLGAGLTRSRARLKELAPGVHGAAPPGRSAHHQGSSREEGEQSPISAMDLGDAEGSAPLRLPKRLQRTGSSTQAREPEQAGAAVGAGPTAAHSAAASPLRFQEAGVPGWCFWAAGEVVLPRSATLGELKRRILALPAFERERAAGALPGVGGLRVREVRESQAGPGLGKEYRDLHAPLAQLGVTTGQQLAVRILPPEERPAQEEGPLSDCDSLPELVDYTEDDGSGGSAVGAAGGLVTSHTQEAPDMPMGEASADLDLDEAAAGLGGGSGLELPTSSGSGTSGGARGLAGPRAERGSTSMEVAVGDEPGDEVNSSAGLPDPGDLHDALHDSDLPPCPRTSSPPPTRPPAGSSRHALLLTVQRRVPLPPKEIPPVPLNLARRAVQALGPASRAATSASASLPLSEASPNVPAPPPSSPLVSPYFRAASSVDAPEQGVAGPSAGPSHSSPAGSVALPSPIPQTIPLPGYLADGAGIPASTSGTHARPPGAAPARSLPLSDASLGFVPLAKKSPTSAAYSSPAPPMQLHNPDPSWTRHVAPLQPPSTPANVPPSQEAQTGMQVLFHVASHLQKQNGSTPPNLHFLHSPSPASAPPGFAPSPNGLASPPTVKRQFAFTSPEEVTLDTGRAVLTAADLKAFLAAHFGIPAARLRVIKVDAAKLKVLPEDDTPLNALGPQQNGPGSQAGLGAPKLPLDVSATSLDGVLGLGKVAKGKSAAGKAGLRPTNSSLGASVNLRSRHFYLKDGDTIVAMDAAEDPEREDTWCAGSLGPGWGGPVKIGPAPLNTTWEGSGYHKGPSIGPTEKKQRRPEAALRIRMDEFD